MVFFLSNTIPLKYRLVCRISAHSSVHHTTQAQCCTPGVVVSSLAVSGHIRRLQWRTYRQPALQCNQITMASRPEFQSGSGSHSRRTGDAGGIWQRLQRRNLNADVILLSLLPLPARKPAVGNFCSLRWFSFAIQTTTTREPPSDGSSRT